MEQVRDFEDTFSAWEAIKQEFKFTSPVRTYIYLHGDDGANYCQGTDELEMEPGSEQVLEFSRTAYEIILHLVVDLDTGKAVCTHLQGMPLVKPVAI